MSHKWAHLEEKQELALPTATIQIYEFIEQELKREKDNNVNRCSAATMCVRRRWYQHHGYEGTPLTPRKIVNFMMGDLAERIMLYFVKEANVGPDKLYSEINLGEKTGEITIQGKKIDLYAQKILSFKLFDGTTITGHADGFGRRNSDKQWELIEVKSAADYGFDDFVTDGPGDYLKQSHALMLTEEAEKLNIESVRFFYLKKSTGHIHDRFFDYDPFLADRVYTEFKMAIDENIPAAPFGLISEKFRDKPTGRIIAPFPCSYCPYLQECKGPYQKEFKNGSPKFIFKGEEQCQKS